MWPDRNQWTICIIDMKHNALSLSDCKEANCSVAVVFYLQALMTTVSDFSKWTILLLSAFQCMSLNRKIAVVLINS